MEVKTKMSEKNLKEDQVLRPGSLFSTLVEMQSDYIGRTVVVPIIGERTRHIVLSSLIFDDDEDPCKRAFRFVGDDIVRGKVCGRCSMLNGQLTYDKVSCSTSS